MISVSGLSKSFGTVRAVHEASFDAADGEITGLLGHNGAGKTTTLRMAFGLLKPDSGAVAIDGINVASDPDAARRRMGALPDSRGLYLRLSALENVVYFGELNGLSRAEATKRATALLQELSMGEHVSRRVDGFSQGERMKVAIARALIHDPKNVILDEPTNGLDVMSTRNMREFIRGLKSAGRCVVFSSHIMQEVAALCDRIVIMAQGTVVAEGTGDELLERAGCKNLEDAFVALTAESNVEQGAT